MVTVKKNSERPPGQSASRDEPAACQRALGSKPQSHGLGVSARASPAAARASAPGPRAGRRVARCVRSLRTSVTLVSGQEATVPSYLVSPFVQLNILSCIKELFIFVAYSIFN